MAKYLITGAAGGMGSALCRRLAKEGHEVWGIDCAPVKNAAGWHFLPADITKSEEVAAAFDQIRQEAGHLNGIIHMAGIYDLNSLVEMPEEDFIKDFNVNLFGMFRINRRFLPLLNPKSRIVIVSSELAPRHPLPFTGIYAVTKTAVDQYAAALRMELQLLGHQVIVLRPGAVRTAMLPASTKKLDQFCSSTQLYSCNAARFKKIVGAVEARNVSPEKIASVVSHALSVSRPRLIYSINQNPLLLLYQALPARCRLLAIRTILK